MVWAVTFLSVFLGPFAVREMTGSFALGGLPFAMYYLSNLLVVFPAGRLMDRLGRAPVLALGHGIGGLGAAAVGVSLAVRGGGLLVLVGFLGGLFLLSAGSSIAFLTRVAAADLYPMEERARGIGRIVLVSFAGSLLGAAAFVLLVVGGNVPVASGYFLMVPFFGAGAASMGFLALTALLPRSSVLAKRGGVRDLLSRPGVAWTVAGNAGAQAGMGGVMSFASAALMSLGGVASGAIMLGHFGGMFLPSPLAGRFADRRGRAAGILLGGIVLGVGATLFMRTDLAAIAGVGLFCVGAGWCLTYIPGSALLADATSLAERGSLFGANDTVASVVGGAMTLLAGFLYTAWGAAGLAVLGLGCGLLPLAAGILLRRNAVAGPSHRPREAATDGGWRETGR